MGWLVAIGRGAAAVCPLVVPRRRPRPSCPIQAAPPGPDRREANQWTCTSRPCPWRRLCGGNQQETCVEVAPLTGADDVWVLRDSKNPGAGELRFTGAELRAAGIRI